MSKAILFVCLFVVVLAENESELQMGKQLPRMREIHTGSKRDVSQNRIHYNRIINNENGGNLLHNRVARQMPQMPGGMNPGDMGKMMTDGIQKGIGTMANMMDPSKWMQAASQMIPNSNDNH